MFGGGRRSSKSKNKGSSNTSRSDPATGDGRKEKLIPNLEMDDDGDGNGDDKPFFYSRRLSKERESNYSHHPSFRVYYGDVSLAVPFTWESQPGTPKSKYHVDSDRHLISYSAPLPPLTPPPSYFSGNYSSSSSSTARRRQLSKKQSSTFRWPTKLFMGFLKRPNNYASPSSSSDDYSTVMSPAPGRHSHSNDGDNLLYSRRRVSSLESLLDLKLEGSDPDHGGAGSSAAIVDGPGSGSGSGSSPTSTLCFGGSSRLRGRYGWL